MVSEGMHRLDYLSILLNTVVMAGYIRGEGNGDSDIHSNNAFTDISLNGALPIVDGLTLRPKAGYRFKYSNIGVDEFSDVDLDLYKNTLYGQVGLRIAIVTKKFFTLTEAI